MGSETAQKNQTFGKNYFLRFFLSWTLMLIPLIGSAGAFSGDHAGWAGSLQHRVFQAPEHSKRLSVLDAQQLQPGNFLG
jgi:hypothetical protein